VGARCGIRRMKNTVLKQSICIMRKNKRIAPYECPVKNFAFDVCPAKYITGIITEEGICYPPFTESLKKAKLNAEKRIEEEMKFRHLQKAEEGADASVKRHISDITNEDDNETQNDEQNDEHDEEGDSSSAKYQRTNTTLLQSSNTIQMEICDGYEDYDESNE
jgi:hypothetical protein